MSVVVIVPGFSGSELYGTSPLPFLTATYQVWLNYGLLASGGWRLLGLQADGATPTSSLTGPLIPGLPLGDYYGTLCEYLTARGWSVIGARLDWRQQLARDGQRLADLVVSLAGQAPVHLVAHSRGGLVCRKACQILSAAGKLSLIGRGVGLGVPHQGTWLAAAFLSGFERWTYLVSLLVGIRTFTTLDLVLSGDLRAVTTSWPGAYELLPAPFASGIDPVQVQTVYDAANWSQISRNVSGPWLDAAQVGWSSVPLIPASIPWLDVIGTGLLTQDQLLSSNPPLSYSDFSPTFAGDGVVLQRWASQPDRPQYVVQAQHSALPYDGRVMSAVDGWLRTGAVAGQQSALNVPA